MFFFCLFWAFGQLIRTKGAVPRIFVSKDDDSVTIAAFRAFLAALLAHVRPIRPTGKRRDLDIARHGS
jgi:hypothetical protein